MQLVGDQRVGGLHAGALDGFLQRFALGQVLQQLPVQPLGDGVLGGHGLAALLLDVAQLVVELGPEVGRRNLPRAGADDPVADVGVECVLHAPNAEGDDQQTEHRDRHRRFREGFEGGHHGGRLLVAMPPSFVGAPV